MGGLWLEKNLSAVINNILDLVANPKVVTSHMEAVYSRRCVGFILRQVLGKMLGEKSQVTACKELNSVIYKHMNALGNVHP